MRFCYSRALCTENEKTEDLKGYKKGKGSNKHGQKFIGKSNG